MELSDTLKLFYDNLSGKRAKEYVAIISSYHRIQGSKGYDGAVDFVKSLLRSWDYDVVVHEYPADGRTAYTDGWIAPIGWTLNDGLLKVVKPHEYTVCTVSESPLSVVVHSRAIDEFEAEVVDVSRGTHDNDYRVDVEGKFVLASGPTRLVHYMAVEERGAMGILFYDEKLEGGIRRYRALWPRYDEIDRVGVMFSLSLKEATRLKSLLRRGKVVVKGFVRSTFHRGSLKVVEAHLPGHSDEYMLLIAHLCHPKPGAHDNASGSGLLLELARVFKTIVEKGGLSMEKGLKFLWVPEFYGTIAYIEAHRTKLSEILGVLNLDMVGAYQDKTGGSINVIGIPPFSQSILPLLAYTTLSRAVEVIKSKEGRSIRYSYEKYSGGSDHHVFVDPILSIPATAYIQWPDKFWHTDADSIDNIDPVVLKTVGIATSTLSALILTAKGKSHLTKLLHMITTTSISILANLSSRYERTTPKKVEYMGGIFKRSLPSLLRLVGKEGEDIVKDYSSRLTSYIDMLVEDLTKVSKKEIPLEIKDERVYKRNKKCMLNISNVLRNLPYERALFWYEADEVRGLASILYYMLDGNKTVSQVYEELKYYLDSVDPSVLNRILEDLERGGWISRVT